jgi:hypothetical protein
LDDAQSLVPLGRSWLRPPQLVLKNGAKSALYDITQRCYLISGRENNVEQKLEFVLRASPDSPIVNPAFVVENWGDRGAEILVNGTPIPRGKSFRCGLIRRINRFDLVIWLHLGAEKDTVIAVQPKTQR